MRPLLLVLLLATPLEAQNWSASIGSGPFVFGHFAERTAAIGNENGGSITRSRLSAATRAGATADVEHDFGRWLGVRLEAAWTRAPLSIKSSSSSSGVNLDAGRIAVTSFAVPLVVRLNRGAFQFHVFGGPAYSLYTIRPGAGSAIALFQGTRARWGAAGGAGVTWWWHPRVGVDWQIADTVTGSPFHIQDFSANGRGVRLTRPQNGHATLGVRYRF